MHGIEFRDPTADRRVVETVLGFSDRQLVAPLDRRPIYERAFADLMGPPAPRMRGLQSADWHLAYEPEAIRAAMRRYANHAIVRDMVDIEAVDRALDCWPRSDPASCAFFVEDLLEAVSLASFLSVRMPSA